MPRYRVLADGSLERCHLVQHGKLHGAICDFTVADVHLAVLPLQGDDA